MRGQRLTCRQSKHVEAAFKAERTFLMVATKAKRPEVEAAMKLLKDLQMAIERVDETKQQNRDHALRDGLTMVADGIGSLGWIMVETSPKPYEYIHELFGGAQMYGNKVLKEYRDK